ncbi:MAG: DUF115 domain-containing protein [Prevotella sp.]|nr:DUF115 domain-containing protein [Prevotella sp.]
MAYKKILKQLCPPIIIKLIELIKCQRANFQQSPLPQVKHNSDKIIIIGNGPSLNTSIDLYLNEIKGNDRIAVNFFASSDYYELLKPNFYVFADPAFFYIPENQRHSIEFLFYNILTKTNWPLQIIIPLSAKGAPSIIHLHENNNIKIDYYFDGNQKYATKKMSRFEAWNYNYIAPPVQNVLNLALYLAIYWQYNEIYLIGADSSFLEDIYVDQTTNEIFTIDTHFYKRERVYKDKDLFDRIKGRNRSNRTMHDLIYKHGKMFEYYYDLKKYAEYRGVKVYNASEYSWINVFERKKIK